jgi:hypothetical protein
LALLLAAWLATGCGQDETKVYRVTMESPPQPQAQAGVSGGHPDIAPTPARARLTWKTPAGWTEISPGEMRVASFNVKGAEGKKADMSVIPLPGMAGGDAANVNRWRGQMGLPPATEEVLRKSVQVVEVDGQPAELHDVAGNNSANGEPARILAVIQHRAGAAWFFKMTGDDALVAKEKPAFIEFLKSFQSAAAETSARLPPSHPPIDGSVATPASVAPSSEGQPKWEVPSGWKEVPGGQFLVAKFSIAGDAGAQAAVNVSMSAGDGGGLAANVNRWRGQLGQSPWSASEMEEQAKEIEVAGGKATLVYMRGTDARSGQAASLAGTMVMRGGQTWFYKLMGDAKVVESQKEAFIKFVKEVKY